jgi:hypothetical protein
MVNDENGTSSSSIPMMLQNDFSSQVVLSASAISGTTTPIQQQQQQRLRRFDVSATMDRLRSSFAGPVTEDSSVVTVTAKTSHPPPDNCITTMIENEELESDNNNNKNLCADNITSTFYGNSQPQSNDDNNGNINNFDSNSVSSTFPESFPKRNQRIFQILHQIPAIILIGMFHLMIGIPFGVSYFPIGWTSTPIQSDASFSATTGENNNNDHCHEQDCDTGNFPLPGYVHDIQFLFSIFFFFLPLFLVCPDHCSMARKLTLSNFFFFFWALTTERKPWAYACFCLPP